MLRSFILWALCILLLSHEAAASASLRLTSDEISWIKSHRQVSYAYMPVWPLEYDENGQHRGLSRAYLNAIGEATGLRFIPARTGELPQLYTNLVPALMPASVHKIWSISQRWMTSNTLIVTGRDTSSSRTLDHLQGKRVAVLAGTWHEAWLREHSPGLILQPVTDADELFRRVYTLEADAGIGPDLVLRPLLHRAYSHKLVVAGQIPSMVAGIHMGIEAHNPLLLDIVNKALSAMPARQADAIYNNWAGELQLGTPSFGVIFSQYAVEMGLFILLLLALVILLYRSVMMKRRAVHSEQRTNQFLAMMSHEIRTPMNALIAALELLRLPCPEERRKEYVELACSSSENLLTLLNNILDHTKLSQNQMRLEQDCFSLSATLNALVAAFQPLAIRKGLTLELSDSLGNQGGWIISDEYRLRQVVANLISNAIKFTESGGVRLSLYWMSGEEAEGQLCIDVVDTGIGIAKENQHRLFAAWTQVDTATTRRYDGSGLGLYISHQLIRLAGGTLQCYSQPGAGSTFRIQLPARHCVPPSPVAEPFSLPRYEPNTSILVVEDHQANQRMLGAQLEQLGCHYDIAPDGTTALRLLEEENYYDVMLLDCNLPDIDGYEVARRVRQMEIEREFDPMPVIAVSAMSGEVHQKRCHACGIDALLTKPVSLKALSQLLSRWCKVTREVQSVLPVSSPLSAIELTACLTEDIEGLHHAISSSNTRMMIHYAHRIRGAALVYDCPGLASLAEEMESKLREGYIPAPSEGTQWLARLRAELPLKAHS